MNAKQLIRSQDQDRQLIHCLTMMASTIISRQILGYLFLILLSHYCDASTSEQLKSISTNLQHMENLLVQQAQKESLHCLVPINVLLNLIAEKKVSNEENNEGRRHLLSDETDILLKLLLGDRLSSKGALLKQLQHNTNHNQNTNTNVNTNINANQLHARRTFDKNLLHSLNKNQNSNQNFNINTNSNKYKTLFDLSDLSDEIN